MLKTYFFEKKIDFSTNYFKKVDNNNPATPNFIYFWRFMCSNHLLSFKSIGTCLKVKLRLIVKLAKSKNSSKSSKNQFLKKYIFYALANSSARGDDTIMIATSFDCVSSPEENEGLMNKTDKK